MALSDAVSGAGGGAAAGAALGPWGALAGGALGAVSGWFMGDAAAEARKRAELERARRADLANMQTLGNATALAGASGVELASAPQVSSLQLHLNNMAAEFRRQNEWNVKQAEEGASLEGLANTIGLASNLGGSFFNFGKSQNWFMGAAT